MTKIIYLLCYGFENFGTYIRFVLELLPVIRRLLLGPKPNAPCTCLITGYREKKPILNLYWKLSNIVHRSSLIVVELIMRLLANFLRYTRNSLTASPKSTFYAYANSFFIEKLTFVSKLVQKCG